MAAVPRAGELVLGRDGEEREALGRQWTIREMIVAGCHGLARRAARAEAGL